MAYGDSETADRLWAEAATAQAELDRLEARAQRVEAEREPARQALAQARAALKAERAEVEKLDGFGPTRLRSSLGGQREADQARELAELAAAEQAVAAASATLDSITDELGAIRRQGRAVGDPEAMRAEALALKERWFREGDRPEAVALDRIAERLDHLSSVRSRIESARSASFTAETGLEQVDHALAAARHAAATGVGRLVRLDTTRYQRMQDVDDAIARADAQLQMVVRAVGELEPTDLHLETATLHAGFGGWAAGVLSGRGHRRRVEDATVSVRVAVAELQRLRTVLDLRREGLTAETTSLESQRREWLGLL